MTHGATAWRNMADENSPYHPQHVSCCLFLYKPLIWKTISVHIEGSEERLNKSKCTKSTAIEFLWNCWTNKQVKKKTLAHILLQTHPAIQLTIFDDLRRSSSKSSTDPRRPPPSFFCTLPRFLSQCKIKMAANVWISESYFLVAFPSCDLIKAEISRYLR